MKNIHFTLFIISILILNSCGSTSSTTYVNPHAEPHIKMHQDFIDEENQKIKAKAKAKKISENNQSPKLQQILLKKWKDGIDFYAFGNEPSWSLDMDFDQVIRFKNLDGIDFNAPMVEPSKAMDTNVTRYRSVTESGEIIVQINRVACMDNMSGEAFNYRVTVDYKSSVDTDYQSFKGCGNFIPDPRLHDLWQYKK